MGQADRGLSASVGECGGVYVDRQAGGKEYFCGRPD